MVEPWNYNTNGNNLENSFIEVYWIRHGFDVERDSVETKNKYFSLPDHQLPENLILLFGL